ncbi:MAG: hypothetical protein NZM42_14140 [Gemmatales bacterium]|nr:hypothetical protein [Gemmatales bacterium]
MSGTQSEVMSLCAIGSGKDLNPLTEQLSTLRRQVEELTKLDAELSAKLKEHEAIDAQALMQELHHRENYCQGLAVRCDKLRNDLQELRKLELALQAKLAPFWNVLALLDPRQRRYRRELETHKKRYREQEQALVRLDCDWQRARLELEQVRSRWESYQNFDVGAHKQRLVEVREQLDEKKAQLNHLERRWRRVQVRLAGVLEEISHCRQELGQVLENLRIAQCWEDRLLRASTPREKAQIHEECFKQLGNPRPRIVMRELELRRGVLERDLQKLHQRAAEIARRASRSIEKIVLDGNNLCFEGNCFIGLAALKAVVPVLAKDYELYLVFDASIRARLKTGDSKIRGEFERYAEVHVVPSRCVADETILELAGEEESTYILSNDRYADFPDKPAVRQGRIITHQIVAGKVFIPDLDISVAYR